MVEDYNYGFYLIESENEDLFVNNDKLDYIETIEYNLYDSLNQSRSSTWKYAGTQKRNYDVGGLPIDVAVGVVSGGIGFATKSAIKSAIVGSLGSVIVKGIINYPSYYLSVKHTWYTRGLGTDYDWKRKDVKELYHGKSTSNQRYITEWSKTTDMTGM